MGGEEEEVKSILVTETTESNQRSYTWTPIRFDDVPPHRTYHFYKQFRSSSNPNNFLKSIKWSPDGSCFLTTSDDNTLRLFTLPGNESSDHTNASLLANEEDSYAADLVVSEGESVYDFCWYPYMSASDPATCVFATTTRDHPIHLWDATTGLLRCTYRAYDAVDEITAAFSVAFNPGGTKMFAGYNKSIRVFDVHRPGRDFKLYSTLQGNKEGQTGIISALAFCPTHSGMVAAGSYNQTTAIYQEDNMELLYILHGQEGGITHVQFSKDGNYLYSGGRKDGLVHIYDLQTGEWTSGFQAAADTVNGFSFHPYMPMAASSSGHRRYHVPDDGNEILHLSGDENCASVWSFSFASMEDNFAKVSGGDLNPDSGFENLQQQL